MITTAELHRIAEEDGLRFDQVEKDYVILWLLSGLAHSGLVRHRWVFKGGTHPISSLSFHTDSFGIYSPFLDFLRPDHIEFSKMIGVT